MDHLTRLVDVNLLGERLRVLFADAIEAGKQGQTGDHSDAGYAFKALQAIDHTLADTPTARGPVFAGDDDPKRGVPLQQSLWAWRRAHRDAEGEAG